MKLLEDDIKMLKEETVMSNQNLQGLTTGKVRLSFVHLFTPYANQQGGEPKYSTTILVPKSDIATKQKIDMAINAAIQEGVSSKWNGVRPPMLSIPIHDGDGVRPSDGMPFGDECKGHWVFTASSKQPPQVVDIGINPILNQSEIYSGVYGRVSIRFFPYASNGKKGVGCGLGNVQKLEDGEPLGGRTSAASDFGDSSGGYAPAYNPQYQQPTNNQGYRQPSYSQQPAQQQQQVNQGYGQNYQQGYQNPQQQQQPQYDPITGRPLSTGGVMGINDDIPF